MSTTIPQNCTWVGGVSPADLDDHLARGDRSGHYEHLVAQRARILANCPRSHRRRILGIAPDYRHAKSHEITVDLRTGDRRVTSGPVAAPRMFRAVERPAPPPPPPVVIPPTPRSLISPIVEAVAEVFDVTTYDLHSASRQKPHCRARFACYMLASVGRKLSLTKIGKHIGRDHTSVMHGVRRARDLYEHDADWRAKYDATVAALNLAVKS